MSSYICLAYKCFNTQYIHTYGKLAINYPTHACQSVFMYVCMKEGLSVWVVLIYQRPIANKEASFPIFRF